MNKEIELWVDVIDFKGKYQISNNGVLKSLDRYVSGKLGSMRFQKGKIQKPEIIEDGYLRYTLSISKRNSIRKLAHVLVATHFIKNIEDKPQVNHKNGLKHDNRISNLEWCTSQENVRHAWSTGLNKPSRPGLGKTGGLASKAKTIEVTTRAGDFIGVFETIIEAGRITNINPNMISMFLAGKKKKMRSGYIFRHIPKVL